VITDTTEQLEAMIALKTGMETIKDILERVAAKIQQAYPMAGDNEAGFVRGAVIGRLLGLKVISDEMMSAVELEIAEKLDELLPDEDEIINEAVVEDEAEQNGEAVESNDEEDEEEEEEGEGGLPDCGNCTVTSCPAHPEFRPNEEQ
jgi:Ran GTPase-activating protein (RanGAP) involved in mRNA processing and transport